MAEFVESLSSLELPPHIDIDHNLDIMSQFEQLNGSVMENFNLGLMDFSNDNFLPFLENLPGIPPIKCPKPDVDEYVITLMGEEGRGDKKRKLPTESETNSINSAATITETVKKNRSSGSGKRGRRSSKDQVEDTKEVVHVRARRGQATDSHSLAERVRREKINERMRCLQGLVPGCYKTMGMAGVLDEIINYVQSLQNQVEFLSMKLTAASSPYEFSLDTEGMASQQVLQLQGDGDCYLQAEAMARLVRENGEYGECSASFQSIIPF